MLMKYRLIELNLSGIKCIEKPITISFAKRNFKQELFNESLVKTIYGPNGSGKTAIVSAFNIYKSLITDEFPFKSPSFNDLLSNLINKKTNTFDFCVSFAVLDKNEIYRIKHHIVVSKDEFGKYYISFESIHSLNSRLNESSKIFESSDGRIECNALKSVNVNPDQMVLKNNSIVKLFFNAFAAEMKENGEKKLNKNDYMVLFIAFLTAKLVVIYGEKQDNHANYYLNWMVKNVNDVQKFEKNEFAKSKMKEVLRLIPGSNCFDVVLKKDLEAYKKEIKKMEQFVKLLKHNLIRIDVKPKLFEEVYFVNLEFVYKDYSVDYEFESSGVKKICNLFSAFSSARNGSITIIDEIDSNIHDTFLIKLIEYFLVYSNAQIICTTHNVEIMSVTASQSKTIDFLSNDNHVIPWIKTGRLSPSTLYLKGRIQFIPFNLDSSEFAEVFLDE